MKSHDNSSLSSGPGAPWSLTERFDVVWRRDCSRKSYVRTTGQSSRSSVDEREMDQNLDLFQYQLEQLLTCKLFLPFPRDG